MATVCPETDHFIGDFDADRRRDAVEQLRSQLSVIAELGGTGVLTPASWGMFSLRLPPFTPPRQPDEDRKVLLEALVELAEHAAAEGVWLAVEPINRYEDYMVNRLEEAVGLAEEVERETGLGSVRVCADLFHMNIEEDDLAAAIRAAGPRIAHVHVDDTNRLQPGTGHMDFESVFDALRDGRLRRLADLRVPAAGRRPRRPCPPRPGSWPGSSPGLGRAGGRPGPTSTTRPSRLLWRARSMTRTVARASEAATGTGPSPATAAAMAA